MREKSRLDALLKTGQVDGVEADRAKPGRPPLMFRAVPGMDPAGPRDYRMLAGTLADAISRGRDPAGRACAKHLTEPANTPRRGQAIDRLTDLLTDLGFAPEKHSGTTDVDKIGLRNCPFLELARTRREMICPVHLGLMQGALAAWEAPIAVDA
ncbi:transcriptional regulator [Candidatus Mycolicibacterium alkanivorans]|uniref:Transcriptional regulator n=1 Tax=Candidatus Mycolicibacterium alkanivorans TaxID=2954114 RepID=A0ABS9YV41_9MYCO|nr:transcriptional regulator [Candidatus Mycolicibacterium alkanivorans]MCI4675017.1 transcriptional regulator [Candidatus Mycolicibacterium alkanivorans]